MNSFSYCHWNLNSIGAHNFIKMSLLQVWNAIQRFYITCLSGTYLENSHDSDDDQLYFPGHNLIWPDNPKDIQWRRSWIYYRENLPIKVINVNILNQYLVCELSFGSCCDCLVNIYQIPSKFSIEYNTLLLSFKQPLTDLNSINNSYAVSNREFPCEIS